MVALDAHRAMSTQALQSGRIRAGLLDILPGPGRLDATLRHRGQHARATPSAPA